MNCILEAKVTVHESYTVSHKGA